VKAAFWLHRYDASALAGKDLGVFSLVRAQIENHVSNLEELTVEGAHSRSVTLRVAAEQGAI
jgi:hypothetical protein